MKERDTSDDGRATALAKILVGGVYVSAKAYRLPSQKAVYAYQHLYHHLTKEREYMCWRGEYPNGNYTDYITVPKAEFPVWHRRIKSGEAKPEAQLTSDYSQKAARPADLAIYYHNTLDIAKKWCKGKMENV